MSQAVGRHESIPTVPAPVYVTNRTVTAAETETVPTGATRVIISADAAIWYAFGRAAVIPTDDTTVTGGVGSIPMVAGAPRSFFVSPASTISTVSVTGTAHVCFEYSFGFTNGFFG